MIERTEHLHRIAEVICKERSAALAQSSGAIDVLRPRLATGR
jgi:hypothetical protein